MDDPALLFDRAVGNVVEWLVRRHHRRRLAGSAGSARSTRRRRRCGPPASRRRAPATRSRCSIDGAEALPRMAAELRRARVARPPDRLVLLAGLPPGARTSRACSATLLAELAERIDVRVLLWAGAPLPLFRPDRAATSREVRRRARPRHARSGVRLDATRAPAALPPREDDRDRRPHRLRRRHRPHARRRRPVRHPEPQRARTARLARRRGAPRRPGRRRRRGALPPALARGRRASSSPRPADAATARATPSSSSCARVPEHVYDAVPRGDFRILESYIARAALGRAARLPREPVPLVARDRRGPRRASCATRRPTTSALVVLLPAKPNDGADDTRGQLADADRRRRRRRALPRLHGLRARRRRCATPSTSTRRSASSTTAGSRSARRTSTRTRSSTTGVNVVTCDADLARATRLRLWSEHLELARSPSSTAIRRA